MKTLEKLLSKTRTVGECFVWQGHINKSGYGSVWHDGKTRDVHRVAYELSKGAIPEGLCIMHSCDNRPCINPKHLSCGTRLQNTADMIAKGRENKVSGVKHSNAKLTPEIAKEIRERFIPYDKKNGASALAREFGVAQGTVYYLLKGWTWKP